MRANKSDALVEALELALDRDWSSLRSGDLMAVGAETAETERLVTELADVRTAVGQETAHRLAWKSRRNQALLAATAKGLSAAILRIAELRKTLEGASTYGADGRRQLTGSPTGSLSRRA